MLIASATAFCIPAVADAKLVNEFRRDQYRICVYDDVRGDYTDRAEHSLWIDIDGTCPRAPTTPVVPSFATLAEDSVEGDQRVCVYAYGSRRYVRSIPSGNVCSYTPL